MRGKYAIALVFVLATGLAAANSALRGFPPPTGQDAMSYLLGADTFASGRLSNPTHPMWRYFETFHVLQRPSYTSKYPPAQAAVLALGQFLTGYPIVGVWLSFGALGAALLWMLSAWTRPSWAMAVTLAFVIALAPTYWAHGYWGGAVAAAAGAVAYGATRRMVERGQEIVGLSFLLAAAVLVLANSRPYEGALASLPLAILIVRWVVTSDASSRRARLRQGLVPLAGMLAVGATLMALYNRAVTGDWLLFPYVAYERQYDPYPLFSFQAMPAHVTAPNAAFAAYFGWEQSMSHPLSALGYLQRWAFVAAALSRFLLAPTFLWFAFAAMPFAARDRWIAGAIACLGFAIAGMALTAWFDWHYTAPIVACYVAVWSECLRRVAGVRIRRLAIGRWLAIGGLAVLAGNGLLQSVRFRHAVEGSPTGPAPSWAWARERLAILLERRGGKHLVVVSYGPSHWALAEWVYNAANIDDAPVVWARDLGPGANEALLRYFRSRRIWSLRVVEDSGPYVLRPLPVGASPPARTAPWGAQNGTPDYPQVQARH